MRAAASPTRSTFEASEYTNADLALPVPPALVDAIAAAVAERVAPVQPRSDGREQPREHSDRLALTKAQAAESIGMSVDHLERHVLPELRTIRSGRLRLVPVAELERWVDEHAARALEGR